MDDAPQVRDDAVLTVRIASWLRDEEAAETMTPSRIERILHRALHVHQRKANDGRERAATAMRSAEQIQQGIAFRLVTGLQVAS